MNHLIWLLINGSQKFISKTGLNGKN